MELTNITATFLGKGWGVRADDLAGVRWFHERDDLSEATARTLADRVRESGGLASVDHWFKCATFMSPLYDDKRNWRA